MFRFRVANDEAVVHGVDLDRRVDLLDRSLGLLRFFRIRGLVALWGKNGWGGNGRCCADAEQHPQFLWDLNRQGRLGVERSIRNASRHNGGQNNQGPHQELQSREAHLVSVVDQDAAPVARNSAASQYRKGGHQGEDQ
jgi:hypothetical protein